MGHLANHVVICNWNAQSRRIVETIHPALFDENEQDWFPVVIVAPDVDCFPDNDRFEDTLLLPGSPLSSAQLKRANVQDAHTVIIVADRSLANPDDQTLQIALMVRSILQNEERHAAGTPRIVAEVLDAARAPDFRRYEVTGIHEIVCESDLSVRVLAQTNLSPGLTYLLADILEYDANENDVYMVKIPEGSTLVGRHISRFSQLVSEVGSRSFDENNQRPALLLALRRTNEENVDEMLVNPTAARLKRFGPLRVGDALVLLARDPRHARMAIAGTESEQLKLREAAG